MSAQVAKAVHGLDMDILNALLKEGRVTPGYLQEVLCNRSSYVRQRLRALVEMGYVRDLGHSLYEPVRERVAGLWEERVRRNQLFEELQLDPSERVRRGLSLAAARVG